MIRSRIWLIFLRIRHKIHLQPSSSFRFQRLNPWPRINVDGIEEAGVWVDADDSGGGRVLFFVIGGRIRRRGGVGVGERDTGLISVVDEEWLECVRWRIGCRLGRV